MFFNGRKLTDVEKRLHDSVRCIACGVKVESRKRFKMVDGKKIADGVVVPMECEECFNQRVKVSFPTSGLNRGAGRHGVGFEYKRRLGYDSTDVN